MSWQSRSFCKPNNPQKEPAHRQVLFYLHFHFLRHFPKRNIHISASVGKDMLAERKMLSSESVGLSKKAEGVHQYAQTKGMLAEADCFRTARDFLSEQV